MPTSTAASAPPPSARTPPLSTSAAASGPSPGRTRLSRDPNGALLSEATTQLAAPGQQSGQGSPYSALCFTSGGPAAAEEGRSPQLELPLPPPLRFHFSWRKLWRCVPMPSLTLRVLPALARSPPLTPLTLSTVAQVHGPGLADEPGLP